VAQPMPVDAPVMTTDLMAASLLPIDNKSLKTDCKLNSRQLN
jgi:hypothetical protein